MGTGSSVEVGVETPGFNLRVLMHPNRFDWTDFNRVQRPMSVPSRPWWWWSEIWFKSTDQQEVDPRTEPTPEGTGGSPTGGMP